MTLLDFWPTPESVAALVPPASDAAFVAVHRPMSLTRRESGEVTDERTVLEALSTPGVVRVVGPSGSGKSHLLRWMELHLSGRTIRVGPGTDLPAVPPPESGGVSESIRAGLRARAEAARAECDAAVSRGEPPDPKARALAEVHAPGLLLLLDGPLKDELPATELSPADFEFRNVASHKIVDPKLMRYVQKLKTNLQGERTTAADLLNELRTPAPSPAASPDVVYLVDGLPDSDAARQSLSADGVRAVFAVTDDESAGLSGVFFDLSGLPPDSAPELAGAYLNAARLGAEQLEAWFESAGRNPDSPPPPFDESNLSDADRDTLESFGRSHLGHALFPLRHDGLPAGPVNPREFLTDFLPAALAQSPGSVLPAPEPEPVPEPEPQPVAPPDPFAWRRELHAVITAILDMDTERLSALRRLTAGLAAEFGPEEDAEVAAFRAAADAPEGASVAHLTPTVQAWLRATDQLEKYRVRP